MLAVLIDLSGTLHVEDAATPNAVEALRKLRSREDVAVKFVTNTTKESTDCLLERLKRCGFDELDRRQFFTSLSAARRFVEREQLRPFLMLEPEAMGEFEGVDTREPLNAVVVGLAPSMFDYEQMNRAFRLLLKDDCRLIAIHKGRYYKQGDGLALGPGPFPQVIGKPSVGFYKEAVGLLEQEHGVQFVPADVFMIGDDVRDDVIGSQEAGLRGILVKTGKYRTDDELQVPEEKRVVCENFAEAVDHVLEHWESERA
ncbi:Haloacid dehalogenase-like hydrolase domain-containing protein 2 isoform X5 [Aphelenchoides fujianensis]|nr:Haloacid dehalogenase-like hydrolase domain-containing protein 2 isoform X5 [Aphelenchoides fujianensis]